MKSKTTFNYNLISQSVLLLQSSILPLTILARFILTVSILAFINSCNNHQEHPEKKQKKVVPTSKGSQNLKDREINTDKGTGPIKYIKLQPINAEAAEKGKIVFESKCISCHRIYNYVGPTLKGITYRRTPEWIMNMILNPVGMTQNDSIAKQQLHEYRTQMTYQDVNKIEARNMLEYFRAEDEKK